MRQEKTGVGGRSFIRYSVSFKLHVITEIEAGHSTVEGARRQYGIAGESTVQRWLRRYKVKLYTW